uniref:unspecific monooxygenase n=1 Tax=Mamestra brassicae TaxID=55057 RepID=A0A0P0EW60_MAMBR|nr:cytochrome P450 monooxygenase CYP9A [Mamestra brassicae]
MIILLIWVAVLIAVLVLYLRQVYSRFSRYGVKHFKPVPLLGNMTGILFRVNHFTDDIVNLYDSFPEGKFVGRFEFLNELAMIRDIELVKKITVKDFEHFLDHRSIFSTSDSFFSRNLFSLKGQEWKDMRSTLSPAFTSSKMRLMVPFMVEVGDQMISLLKKNIKDTKTGYIDVECKDLTTRYTNDVIASCAFGLKVDSHNEKDNEFYAIGKQSTSFNLRQMMKFFVLISIPSKVSKFLKLDFLSKTANTFFRKLVLDTMGDREARKIIRPDMIHLLMEAKKGKLTHENINSNDQAAGFATVEESSVGQKQINRVWTDTDLIAQAFLFFLAGFETVSAGMSFLLYELALNPDVQERLGHEIKETDAKNGGKFDFNSIQNMPYMDMVVSELLRLWPPAVALDRVCTKDYNLGKPNEKADKDFIVRKGTGLSIPVYAIHRDPQFFPNPDKFDPERFSDENKHNIQTFAYMPFGVGPRNCIGSRFALCEIKVMAYQILQHMELSPCEKTTIPAKLDKSTFNVLLEGGHWLRFRPRI